MSMVGGGDGYMGWVDRGLYGDEGEREEVAGWRLVRVERVDGMGSVGIVGRGEVGMGGDGADMEMVGEVPVLTVTGSCVEPAQEGGSAETLSDG